MLILISRTYRRLAGLVVALAVMTIGLFATEASHLGAARGEAYLADADAPIVATLPEVEVVAEPMEWQ